MSTELSIKLWTKQQDPVKRILEVLQIIEDEQILSDKWQGLTVKNVSTGEVLSEAKADEQWEIGAIAATLKKFEAVGHSLSVSVRNAVSVWRFEGSKAVQGFIPIWLDAWGGDFFKNGAERAIEGDMKLNFLSSGPFTGIITDEETERVQQTNGYVAENLEMLTGLMFSLIKNGPGVERLKCFTDAGTYLPLNAHLVYWENPQAVADDLRFTKKLWDNGLAAYNIKPLKNYLQDKDKYDYHEWRTEEMREALFENLSQVIDNADSVQENWPDKIDWELYDTYTSDNGTMLLNYPLWLNGFVDDFYLDVLKSATK